MNRYVSHLGLSKNALVFVLFAASYLILHSDLWSRRSTVVCVLILGLISD